MNIQEAIDAPRIHHQWLPGIGYRLDVTDATWGQAAGILVGGKSLAEIEKGGGARYNGAIDSRAASGEAIGY
ncbi:Gamma-glutamyl transpeptidase (fragment) [Mesorhizobium delmotii]|uniref:Gamma-glutamyl transpeptidase n=2 Tax=Mesorhizobium delmotii TaxID=1631247 RepID=A0A2P9ACV8_9HYPH